MSNIFLEKAKYAKNDEFYTRYEDIEKELSHYKESLKNKIIYCNCDDPEWSNFYKYFTDHFVDLQLKKVITTHYNNNGNSYKLEYNGTNTIKTELQGNGSFMSDECIEILKHCDIVITNPPFSLFKEYIQTLLDNNKKFLIIGNFNAIKYKIIFPLLLKGEINCGYNWNFKFSTVKENPTKKDLKGVGCCWFFNIKHKNKYNKLELTKTYNTNDYKFFDDYNVLNIDKVADIPNDYFGVMGVPITYLKKHDPNKFEILDARDYKIDKTKGMTVGTIKGHIEGKKKFERIAIKRKIIKE